MLILKPVFCFSKEAAEGNQMTRLLEEAGEDKRRVQTCSNNSL